MRGSVGVVLVGWALSLAGVVFAQTPPAAETEKLTPLNPQGTVLLDAKQKKVILKGTICLRKGTLELLCCLKRTKEHEAIISVDTKAYAVHAGLLAAGAEVGHPVTFDPDYKPPVGQQVDIFVNWTDPKGKTHRVPAQELIRYVVYRFYVAPLAALPEGVKLTDELEDLRYDPKRKELIWYGPMTVEKRKELLSYSENAEYRKAIESFYTQSQSRAMKAHWVFAGSGFFLNEETKKMVYRAEDGDLICVANFPSATLDITTRSSDSSDELLFEAWTEHIPEVETPVTVELIPVKEEAKKEGEKKKEPAGAPPESKRPESVEKQ